MTNPITGPLSHPRYHPTTGQPFPAGRSGGRRWFAVELRDDCWWKVPAKVRSKARQLVRDARRNGTPAWVLDGRNEES